MKITKIPYPRPTFNQYALMSFLIGFTVGFILIVFQPFGTASFRHSNKHFILAGYGITVFITLLVFYYLSTKVIHKNKEATWNILNEVLDVFLVLMISLIVCYIYSVEIFDSKYKLGHMLYFISNAALVAMLPVSVCLGYLYMSWKDVVRSSIKISDDDKVNGKLTLVLGNNKSDQIEATSDEIILAQAQSNYVMLHIQKENKIQRHIIRSTLKQIKNQLDENIFIQAHRSYIVNKHKIKLISGNKSKALLELEGFDKKIPVSRSIYDTVKSFVK